MKGFKFEFKVLLLLLLGLILVIAIGFATYNRFAQLFDSVLKASRPDMELVLTHVIQNDVNEMSNIVKIKSLRLEGGVREEDFHTAKQNVLANLYLFNKMHAKAYNEGAELIDSLVMQKIYIADGLFYAEDPYRVQKALNKVVTTIGYTLKKNKPEPLKVKETILIKEKVISEVEVQKVEAPKVEVKEEKKFRLFKRKDKEVKTVAKDSVTIPERKATTSSSTTTTTVKAIDTLNRAPKNSLNKVIEGISKVRVEEQEIEDRIKDANLDLVRHEVDLDRELNMAFDRLKKIELEEVKEATLKADEEAKNAWRQITMLAASVGLLLFILGYLIMRYAHKNNVYKVALKKSAADSRQFVLAKERFMSNVSHELRTPMHAIQGFAEILANEELEETQQEYVKMIQSSTQHMSYLLNDVLDLAKLRNEKLRIVQKEVEIHALIEEVWLYAQQLNQKATVEMRFENTLKKGMFVKIDSYRLRQVLLNILSNAIKFTATGFVCLKASLSEDNKQVVFEVQDTGIGMSPDETALIFEEYTQAQAETAHQFGGTGLGLTISKKLIELMEGDISLLSEKGVGTTMKVNIPYLVCEAKECEVILPIVFESPFERILVVDDELYNRKYLEGILGGKVNQLYFGETAEQGLEILKGNSMDLILLDYRLPGMNGVAFLHEMKSKYTSEKQPKVIVLTAALDDEQYEELILLGVNGVLDKPFSAEKLFMEMERIATHKLEIPPVKSVEKNQEVDFSAVKGMFGQDQAFYKEMLETFVQSTEESLVNIKLAFEQKDVQLIGHEAHKIASPSKHLGAKEMYQLLKRMEKNAKEGLEVDRFKRDIKELESHYTIVKEKINIELASII